MTKNIAIGILVILCLAEGFFIFKQLHQRQTARKFGMNKVMPTMMAPRRPTFLTPGTKFSDSPLFSKAYKIFPGDLSDDAKKALTGWDLKQIPLADGSTQVNLVPHEAEDVQQEFIVKPGFTLYFIEMNLADDTTQKDNNRSDDMGVLVDQNGMVE